MIRTGRFGAEDFFRYEQLPRWQQTILLSVGLFLLVLRYFLVALVIAIVLGVLFL